jgi:ferredoxin
MEIGNRAGYHPENKTISRRFREQPPVMPTVTFVKEKKTIEVPEGANLRREAIKAGVQLYPFPHNYANCMGNGLCCSCRVLVKKGLENCSRQGLIEKLALMTNPDPRVFFSRLGHEKDLRLACKTRVNGDIEVETQPPVNWHGEKFWG